MNINIPKPPKLLSDLIQLALTCADKCAADPRYKFYMVFWHAPCDGVCFICLAGAVIAKTLGADPSESVLPNDYPPEWSKALLALNYICTGTLGPACETFGIEWTGPRSIDGRLYDWRENAEECMQMLKEAGL
jgi:hypothetical protein